MQTLVVTNDTRLILEIPLSNLARSNTVLPLDDGSDSASMASSIGLASFHSTTTKKLSSVVSEEAREETVEATAEAPAVETAVAAAAAVAAASKASFRLVLPRRTLAT